MTPDEQRLFGCPYCGFRVSATESACPRCGNTFTKDTTFECPFCGQIVPSSSKSCPACHVDYIEFGSKTQKEGIDSTIDSLLMEIIRLEASQVKKEDKRLSCPNCDWMIDGTEEKCPKCGAAFTENISFQCPICATLVDPTTTQCPECGSSFLAEEGAVPQEAGAGRIRKDFEEATSALTDILSTMGPELTEPEPKPEPLPEKIEEEVKTVAVPIVTEEAKVVEEPEPGGLDEETVQAIEQLAKDAAAKKSRKRKLKAKKGKKA